jgi:tRNA(fMet)-specific endonuclease VapC
MTAYLLDTNICIHIINGKFDLAARLKRADIANCYLSELTVAELLYGVANSSPTHQLANRQRLTEFRRLFAGRILPISDSLETYAQQKAHLKRIGRLQGEFDMLIGSVAVAHGFTLVTHNTRHFADMVGIVLEDWVKEYEDEQGEFVDENDIA